MRSSLVAVLRSIRGVIEFDPRSLAFVRILLAGLVSISLCNYLIYAEILLSDGGVLPRRMSLGLTAVNRFSLLLGNGSALYQRLLLVLGIGAAVLFGLNIRTRTMLVISWAIFYSVIIRASAASFGLGPGVLGVMFWSLFLPWERIPRSPFVRKEELDSPAPIIHWAACGLFFLGIVMSFGAGLAKHHFFEGWIVDQSVLRADLTYYTNDSVLNRFLGRQPLFVKVAGPTVLIVEMLVPFFLLAPWARRYLIPLALALLTLVYIGITLTIHVGLFPLVTLTGLYLTIPSAFWERIASSNRFRKSLHAAFSTLGRIAGLVSPISRGARLCLKVSGMVMVGCFVLRAYASHVGSSAPSVPPSILRLSESLSKPIFDLFFVETRWDWVYGGPMQNRFLLVRVVTPQGERILNVTSVEHHGPIFDYLMNYSNSILGWQSDPERLFFFADFFCRRGLHGSGKSDFSSPVSLVQLFDIYDPQNTIRGLSAEDQERLNQVTQGKAPFFSLTCRGGSEGAPGALHRGGHDVRIQPGSAADLPILGWKQDYGSLRIDRSVDGGTVSIGGRSFERGFGTHANSFLRLAVGGLTRFRSFVGIDDEKGSSLHASVRVRIFGDGRELYLSEILTTKSGAALIDVDISGVNEIRIVTEDAGKGCGAILNCDDHISFGDPMVE